MAKIKKEQTKWVLCASCGHQSRNHRVLHEKITNIYTDEDAPPSFEEFHRLAECMGCNSIKYVVSRKTWYFKGDEVPPWENPEIDIKVYPDAPGNNQRVPAISKARLPEMMVIL